MLATTDLSQPRCLSLPCRPLCFRVGHVTWPTGVNDTAGGLRSVFPVLGEGAGQGSLRLLEASGVGDGKPRAGSRQSLLGILRARPRALPSSWPRLPSPRSQPPMRRPSDYRLQTWRGAGEGNFPVVEVLFQRAFERPHPGTSRQTRGARETQGSTTANSKKRPLGLANAGKGASARLAGRPLGPGWKGKWYGSC